MTLREHLEAIRDLHPGFHGVTWQHAVAALKCLDESERPGLQDMYLGGFCSCDASRSDCCTCDQGYALVADPRRQA